MDWWTLLRHVVEILAIWTAVSLGLAIPLGRWLKRDVDLKKEVKRLRCEPGDVGVLTVPYPITREQAERIKEEWKALWRGTPKH